MIKSALRKLLIDASIVGNRIYPLKIPQNPIYPLITYQRISGAKMQSLKGSTGKAHPRYQIDIWAKKYDDAVSIAHAATVALDGYKGTVLGVEIKAINFITDRDFYEEAIDIHRRSVDFYIWYTET